MHRPIRITLVLLVVLAFASFAAPATADPAADEVFWRVNEARADRGLAPLARFPTDEQVVRANDDYAATLEAHRISSQNMDFYVGLGANAYGENQGAGSPGTSPSRIVGAWIDSPGHAANMFSTTATHLAAAATSGSGRRVFTIHLITAPSVDASDPGPSRPAGRSDDEPSSTDDEASSGDPEPSGGSGEGTTDAGGTDDQAGSGASEDPPEQGSDDTPVEEPEWVSIDPDAVAPFREDLAVAGPVPPGGLRAAPEDFDPSELPAEDLTEPAPAGRDDAVDVVATGVGGGSAWPGYPVLGLGALTLLLLVAAPAARRRRQVALQRSLHPRSRTPRGRSRRSARSAREATASTAAAAPTSRPMSTSDGQWTRR